MDSTRYPSPFSSSPPQNDPSRSPPGLLLHSSPAIRNFLLSAASCASLSDGMSASASQFAQAHVVPYCLLRDVWAETPSCSRPRLRHLLAGTTFCFQSPAERVKSDELKARLEKLQDLVDRKAYGELVKDVNQDEQRPESFSSYKDQLGFGLHVMLTMFTCFLVGYALFRSQFGENPALHAAGGLLGLVIGMLVETLLFIIKFSRSEVRSSSWGHTIEPSGSGQKEARLCNPFLHQE